MTTRGWDDQEIKPEEVAPLVGKTIAGVEMDSQYERTHGITFRFTDGSSVTVREWNSYADDAGLDLKIGGVE